MQRNRKEKITGPAAADDIAPYFSNHCNYRELTCRPDFLDMLYILTFFPFLILRFLNHKFSNLGKFRLKDKRSNLM